MALLYMEEELFAFEKILVKSNETRSDKSEIISQLTGYEIYIDYKSENGAINDYKYLHNEIDSFIMRHDKCSINEIDRNSEYYKFLSSRIASGKFKAIKEMYHIYFGATYNYKVLDENIDAFEICHGFSQYNKYRTQSKKKNTDILVQAIESYNNGKSENQKRSVNDLVNDKTFYTNLNLIPISMGEDKVPAPSTLSKYHSKYKSNTE